MQHTLLISQNHLRGLDFHQALQAVVTNNDTTVKVVQVGCGKTATIKRNEGTQLGRSYRNNLHNHPFRTIDTLLNTCAECLNNLQALQGFVLALHRRIAVGTVAQFIRQRVKVETNQQFVYGLGTHLGYKLVGVAVVKQVVVLRKLVVDNVVILILRQQVVHVGTQNIVAIGILATSQHTRLNDDITFVIDNGIQLLCRKSEQIAYFVRQ